MLSCHRGISNSKYTVQQLAYNCISNMAGPSELADKLSAVTFPHISVSPSTTNKYFYNVYEDIIQKPLQGQN